MKKKLIIGSIASIALIGSFSAGVFAAGKISLLIDGKKQNIDVQLIKNVPYINAIQFANTLKYKAAYNSKTGSLTFNKIAPAELVTFKDIQAVKTEFGWDVSADVTANKSFKGIVLTLSFYNAAGARLGTATGSVSDIVEGETKTVQFITTNDLTDWTKVKPQIDMKY